MCYMGNILLYYVTINVITYINKDGDSSFFLIVLFCNVKGIKNHVFNEIIKIIYYFILIIMLFILIIKIHSF